MIKSVKLELSGGEFEIARDVEFSVSSDFLNHLVYEKNGVYHVISDPCKGRYAKTVITLPFGYAFNNFSIKLTDGTVRMCPTESKNTEIDIKNASAEFCAILSKNLYISSAKADLSITADFKFCSIDCGYGTVTLNMSSEKNAYSINSKCGMGKVTLNSMLLPKQYKSSDGEKKIHIICGMGDVNINTARNFADKFFNMP